ncbi:hypothetical protein B0T25DRAFT_488889 [Lasiosphaeria hispida]|uniref:Uncharacterized protein n=1 Tax=Lasiosphaeria hispida TaxID=260671 RepID=A0AAJ0H744_9PEZI|nr:hypothetical protein B0T25DRAFT_488889 [Lasiosphaeria hispida]
MANSSPCLTPACLQVSSLLLNQIAINWDKMDPCTDFDKMVCSRYTEVNGDNSNFFTQLTGPNNRILRTMLESPYEKAVGFQAVSWNDTFPRNSIDEANFNILRRDYLSCMDTDAIVALGAKPLTDLLGILNGIWPIDSKDVKTEISKSDYDSINQAVYFLEDLGVHAFATPKVAVDPENPKSSLIAIMKPDVYQKNTSTYADPAAAKDYSQLIAAIFLEGFYPAKLSDTTAETIGKGIVELETDIAAAIAGLYDGAPEDTGRYNITSLKSVIPAPVTPDKLITSLLSSGYAPEKASIIAGTAPFWGNLSQILVSHPKTIVQSWLVWKTVVSLKDDIHHAQLAKLLPKQEESQERYMECLGHTDRSLRLIQGRFYASAAYPDSVREYADKLATDIRNQFKLRLKELPWMGEEAKKRAAKKVDNMVQNVGYPTSKGVNTRSPESLAAYYRGLNITDNYFANVLASRHFGSVKSYRTIGQVPDRGTMDAQPEIAPTFAGASYVSSDNSINIQAGISRLPIFTDGLPTYAAYGGLGAIVGHEILHGFDTHGRLYDENAVQVSWWDKKTIAAYEEKQECFVEQYNKFEYPIPGGKTANTDGKQTLAENLSDAGGLRIAFDAFRAVQKKQGPDLLLPGLERFTQDQLFFIFYANIWCSSSTPERNLVGRPQDEHAYNPHRILGGIANSRGFREAFKCKVKEPTCELF